MNNEYVAAEKMVTDGDCGVILHFNTTLDLGLVVNVGSWHKSFGFYDSNNPFYYYCATSTGSDIEAWIEDDLTNETSLRLVCACTGNW